MKRLSNAMKAVGKAVWKVLPWAVLWIWICFLIAMPIIHAQERGEQKWEIAALEAENRMYQSENDLLREEVDWLRSQIGAQESGK
jgi:hypothetical protein